MLYHEYEEKINEPLNVLVFHPPKQASERRAIVETERELDVLAREARTIVHRWQSRYRKSLTTYVNRQTLERLREMNRENNVLADFLQHVLRAFDLSLCRFSYAIDHVTFWKHVLDMCCCFSQAYASRQKQHFQGSTIPLFYRYASFVFANLASLRPEFVRDFKDIIHRPRTIKSRTVAPLTAAIPKR